MIRQAKYYIIFTLDLEQIKKIGKLGVNLGIYLGQHFLSDKVPE